MSLRQALVATWEDALSGTRQSISEAVSDLRDASYLIPVVLGGALLVRGPMLQRTLARLVNAVRKLLPSFDTGALNLHAAAIRPGLCPLSHVAENISGPLPRQARDSEAPFLVLGNDGESQVSLRGVVCAPPAC